MIYGNLSCSNWYAHALGRYVACRFMAY